MIRKWIYFLIIFLLVVAGCSNATSANKANLDEEVFEKGNKLAQLNYIRINDGEVPEQYDELREYFEELYDKGEFSSSDEETFVTKLVYLSESVDLYFIGVVKEQMGEGNIKEYVEKELSELRDTFGISYESVERLEGEGESEVSHEQTEKEGSDKAFEYSLKINGTAVPNFVKLATEVKKGEVELSGVYTKQRFEQVKEELNSLIQKYRTEVINLPNEEKEANEIYLRYLDGLEIAMASFEEAIKEDDKNILIQDTTSKINSAYDDLTLWAKMMGIPTDK